MSRFFTITEITQYVKTSLERDPNLTDIWVSGEVSNLRAAPSGHTYFTLKDSKAQLRSVMFKGGEGSELLAEGCQVTAHGRLSFYETRGDIQIICDIVRPEGEGPLALELARLKIRLEEEGLFDPSRKRPLPAFPKVVGLVTSSSGAVLHDILNIIGRRYPLVEILLAPTLVQGEGAAMGIVSALHALNEDASADVIILARGGGSLEELWPFNEEVVARAIYASHIPVVSAVGHETDQPISDYVADMRAPTPSAAAELVVPDRVLLSQDIDSYTESLSKRTADEFNKRRMDVDMLAQQLRFHLPDLNILRRRVDDLSRVSHTAMSSGLSLWRERINGFAMSIQAMDPKAILHRGYAIVLKRSDGQILTRTNQATSGDQLDVRVSDGSISATVGTSTTPSPGPKIRTKKPEVRAGAPLL